MTIWCDVEDLFEYGRALAARPSGIQRLSFEMYAALRTLNKDAVGFVRIDALNGTMRVVAWEEVEELFLRLVRAPLRALSREPQAAPMALTHSRLARLPLFRAAVQGMSPELRRPLGDALRAQIAVFPQPSHRYAGGASFN